jgi:hypothetical protein
MERSILTRHKFVLGSLFALQCSGPNGWRFNQKTSPERPQRLLRSWAGVRLGKPVVLLGYLVQGLPVIRWMLLGNPWFQHA